MYTYPSFLSGYVQNVLGAGSVLVGMIVGSYGFVQMLLRIPLGICSDRVKKRRVFVQAGFLATILSGAGLSLVALAAARGGISPVPVLFLRGLSGGGAAAWVAFSVLAADQAPPDKTGEAMSRISFFQNMATVAAMPLGSWIMTRFGAAWAFALAAAAGAAGLRAAIDYVESIGFDEIESRELALCGDALAKLRGVRGVSIVGGETAAEHNGILTFTLEGVHPHDISEILAGDGVAVRAGHHCAQPLLTHLGLRATVRASLAFYNTTQDIDHFVESLSTVRERMGYGQ